MNGLAVDIPVQKYIPSCQYRNENGPFFLKGEKGGLLEEKKKGGGEAHEMGENSS